MPIEAGRGSERVRIYLAEHPSIRRSLALSIVNDAALARRIAADTGGRLSVEAIAVALRREESVVRTERTGGPAFPQLVGGGTLQLLPDYAVVRLRDDDATWSHLGELRRTFERGRHRPNAFIHVEEGAPRITLLLPSGLVARVRKAIPPRSVVGVTRRLALIVLEADRAADDTPGVIAVLSALLTELGILPNPLVAAGRRVIFALPKAPAQRAFDFLHELRRLPAARPPAVGETSSGADTPPPEGPVPMPRHDGGRTGAEVARSYIAGHPSVADCLSYGIVNFTALARRVAAETGYPHVDSLEAALRRSRGVRARVDTVEERLLAVVRASRIELRTKVALVTAPHSWHAIAGILESDAARSPDRRQMFQILQGPTSVTLLCDEELAAPVLRTIGARPSITATYGLSAVIVRSPPTIGETPGVLAYLAQALARAGLNCVELMSVQLESTFVVRQTDAIEVFRVLSGLVHPPEGTSPTSAPTRSTA
jgi:hypothetical protein